MKAFTTATTTLLGVALLWTASLQAQSERPYTLDPLHVTPRTLVVQSWGEDRAMKGVHSGESYSFLTGPGYARARGLLKQKFSHMEFRGGVSLITAQALVGVDLFVLSEQKGVLERAEAVALERWVRAGGALLVTANGGACLLGVTPGAFSRDPSPKIVAPNSELIRGPFGGIAFGIGIGYHMSFATTGDATVVGTNPIGPNILQFQPNASRYGRAVFISDEEIFMTGEVAGERNGKLATHPANEILLCNVVAWLSSVPGASGSFTPIGIGCLGSDGVPEIALQAGSAVKAGQPLKVALVNLPKNIGAGEVMMLVGSFRDNPIDLGVFGAPGCRLYIDYVAIDLGTQAAGGVGTWTVQVPRTPGVPFYSVHIQAAVPDGLANNLGLSLSNAARVEIFGRT